MKTFFALLAVACVSVSAQSWSIGNGAVTYQILFTQWLNPDALTYTGAGCDVTSKCDTRFIGDVEHFGCNASEIRRMSKLSWPGPNDMGQWRIFGDRKYEDNSLRDFAYVNLTGVDCSNFCGAIVRVQIIDVDPFHNDLLDEYIGTVPGCQDLTIPRYESESLFTRPIAFESISIALPQVQRKGTPDLNTIQQQQLHARVRAWGVSNANRNRLAGVSGSGSTFSNSRPSSTNRYTNTATSGITSRASPSSSSNTYNNTRTYVSSTRYVPTPFFNTVRSTATSQDNDDNEDEDDTTNSNTYSNQAGSGVVNHYSSSSANDRYTSYPGSTSNRNTYTSSHTGLGGTRPTYGYTGGSSTGSNTYGNTGTGTNTYGNRNTPSSSNTYSNNGTPNTYSNSGTPNTYNRDTYTSTSGTNRNTYNRDNANTYNRDRV